MTYFDTSYLAKCYLKESGWSEVRALAMASPAIACCQMGEVELTSVFHRHLREGRIDDSAFRIALTQLRSDLADGLWVWLPVTPALLSESSQAFHSLKPSIFLRAADAIHLTCARRNGLREVYSNDRHLLAACETFGLVGRNIL